MKVVVTEDDIRDGLIASLDTCPVALAVLRAYGRPGDVFANVDETAIYIFNEADGSTAKFWKMPFVVGFLISHYDETGEMYPFGFEL